MPENKTIRDLQVKVTLDEPGRRVIEGLADEIRRSLADHVRNMKDDVLELRVRIEELT